MIEISFGKLVLLALIALIVLGPEKLPGAARTAGALLRRMRNGWESVRAEVERELEVEEIRRAAREAAKQAEAVQEQAGAVQQQVMEGTRQVREPVETAVAMMKSADPVVAKDESPADPVDPHQATLPSGEPASGRTEPAHD
ncbi:Sec-independent protein translocase protein TatB [Dyella sp. A6]|uniref:Sec-independent protein translocase protein TatB n=1 Tax=Dyella aluminiiresistens TaxID=3069105 RepID=UPI002E792E69|nr:Sec-independent protein translocase protein TatB [Dyella sp. A6]